jgi:putative protease
MPEEGKLVGEITHYFGKIGVAVLKLSDVLRVGDTIKIVGADTEFTQPVESMQIEHQNIQEAKAGDLIGLKVSQKVKEGYKVYKI